MKWSTTEKFRIKRNREYNYGGTHKYNTSRICTLLLCRATFLLCWALFGSSKHLSAMPRVFFCYAKHFSAILSGISALPSSFQLCWAFFCSANHFSSVLSRSKLCQAFFGYAKHFLALPILSGFTALLSIFLLCWTFCCPTKYFTSMLSVFFCSAKHLSAMLNPFLLCQALFFYAVQYTAEQNNTRQSRKTT